MVTHISALENKSSAKKWFLRAVARCKEGCRVERVAPARSFLIPC